MVLNCFLYIGVFGYIWILRFFCFGRFLFFVFRVVLFRVLELGSFGIGGSFLCVCFYVSV